MIKKRTTQNFIQGTILLLLPLIIGSCMKHESLKVQENPVIIPASSIIHKVRIKNIVAIDPVDQPGNETVQNPEDIFNKPSPNGPVKNEWVSCYLYGETLTLYLGKNTSPEPRSFKIGIRSEDTADILTITQLGATE